MEIWEGEKTHSRALYVCQAGQQICESLHQYGPAMRDHTLLHFVASGAGTFYSRGEIYPVKPGQGFAIFPDQITTYRADKRDPWHYYWVGYAGFEAESLSRQSGLTREAPVFSFEQTARVAAIIEQMGSDASGLRMGGMALLGGLYQLLALVGECTRPNSADAGRDYFDKAMWFMMGNYERGVCISDVADHVGLSRSQLFRTFQAAVGRGPKACLTQIRINRALELIEELTLEQVAASVGLSSGARLNALLRESIGMSAGEYRRSLSKR